MEKKYTVQEVVKMDDFKRVIIARVNKNRFPVITSGKTWHVELDYYCNSGDHLAYKTSSLAVYHGDTVCKRDGEKEVLFAVTNLYEKYYETIGSNKQYQSGTVIYCAR